METDIINMTDLKYDLKKSFDSLQDCDVVVLRHSDPVGVIISKDRYDKLIELERKYG